MGAWPVVLAFTLTYLCPFTMHVLRESWAMSKPDVHQDLGFDGAVLGGFDFCFFLFYSAGLYIAGVLGDRYSIRLLLFAGLLASAGVLTTIAALGRAGYTRPEPYFALFCIFGFSLSTVWPGTVAIVATWFPAHHRGRVFGIWSSNLALGNAAGAQIGNLLQNALHQNWTVLLWTGSALAGIVAILIVLFLRERPQKEADDQERSFSVAFSTHEYEIVSQKHGVSFVQALLLPGVIIYSLVFALVKLIHNTLIIWLPFYATDVLNQEANKGNLSALYDLGTILGSYTVGLASDFIGMRSPVCAVMLAAAIPCLYVFAVLSDSVLWPFFVIVPALGIEVGGVSSLIGGAVAADLAKSESREDKSEALATVAGIVDGTGNLGTALGQLTVGWLLESSWNYVFYFLMGCCFLAGLLMAPVLRRELQRRPSSERTISIAPLFNQGL